MDWNTSNDACRRSRNVMELHYAMQQLRGIDHATVPALVSDRIRRALDALDHIEPTPDVIVEPGNEARD